LSDEKKTNVVELRPGTQRKGRALEEHRRRERARNAREREATAVKTPAGYRSVCGKCQREFFSPYKGVTVCGGGVVPGARGKQRHGGDCQRVLAKERLRPYTLAHFERYFAPTVILDNRKPLKLEGFQREFFKDVFAGVRQCWLLIAEGNTKTTSLAALALYHIKYILEGRVPVCAAARDQAFEMYLQAQGMVERSPDLQPCFDTLEGSRMIRCRAMGSRMQVYASDDRTGDGVIYTLALVDELGRHRDMRMYRTWAGKRQKRIGRDIGGHEHPAQIAGISAAGEVGSEFEMARQMMRQQATDIKTTTGYTRAAGGDTVLHEYALPDDGDPADMAQVKLANPFSAITLEVLQAKRNDPTMTASHWMRMTGNRANRGANAAINEVEWAEAGSSTRIPPGVPIWTGLDVAWRQDTTAAVPFWPRDAEFRLFGPATILEPPRDGTSLDPDLVEQALRDLHDVNPIATLVMDTTKAEQLATWAERTLGCEVVDRTQSNALAALDYERWMEALRSGWLFHSEDPGLTKHVLTAIAKALPQDKTRFDRPVASRGGSPGQQARRVIDAMTAASQVHGVYAAELIEDSGYAGEPLVMFA
jgi:hypothetical protein